MGAAVALDDIIATLGKNLSSLLSGHFMVHALELGWQGLVTEILGGIANLSSARSKRTRPNPPDLLMATVLPSKAIINEATRRDNLSCNSATPLPDRIPIAFTVSSFSSAWFSPLVPIGALSVADAHGNSTQLAIATDPSVGMLAAASSCFPGGLVPDLIDLKLADMISFRDRSDLAVCTSPGTCKFPDFRLWDGGWIDNTAIALLVAKLQQEHGLDVPLRIFAVDSVSIDTFTLFGAKGLFFNDSYIFDGNVKLDDFTTHGSVQYLHKTVHTVKNTVFGVQGGQTVELFLLLALENFPLGVVIKDQNDAAMLANFAQDVYNDARKPLQDMISSIERSVDQPTQELSVIV